MAHNICPLSEPKSSANRMSFGSASRLAHLANGCLLYLREPEKCETTMNRFKLTAKWCVKPVVSVKDKSCYTNFISFQNAQNWP